MFTYFFQINRCQIFINWMLEYWNNMFLGLSEGMRLGLLPPAGNSQAYAFEKSIQRSISRWWQLKYFWNFHPENWGRWTQFDEHIVSIGLVQPPTRYVFGKYHQSPVYFYDSWRNKTCDSLLFKDDIIQFDAYQCCDFYFFICFLMKHIITIYNIYLSSIYIYIPYDPGSRFATTPPPHMVWSQNLRFAAFRMKTLYLQCFLHGGLLVRSTTLQIRWIFATNLPKTCYLQCFGFDIVE